MSQTQVGACPKCGAPIYSATYWHGIMPPPPIHTCACVPKPRQVIQSDTGGQG